MLGDMDVPPFWPPFLTSWGLNSIFWGYFFSSTNTKTIFWGIKTTNSYRIRSFRPQISFSLDLFGSKLQRPAAHPHQFSDRVPPPTPTRGCEQTLCHLPMFSAVIRSFGPPRLKRLYQIQRWNRDVGNLMNVTPAIQGYFSSNFSFWLCAVHPTAAQCGFGILSHLTGHYPARDGSLTQSTWCYIRKYVFVNFLRISNENVKYKLVKSPYLLSVS